MGLTVALGTGEYGGTAVTASVALGWPGEGREAGRPGSRRGHRPAQLRVAARPVRHHADSAVGRAKGIEADPAQALDQPAAAAHRTVASADDKPVLARWPHVVAVRADVRRGGGTGRAPVALVALASRGYRGAFGRNVCGPGLSPVVDEKGRGAEAAGERTRRRCELLRARSGGRVDRVCPAALANPGQSAAVVALAGNAALRPTFTEVGHLTAFVVGLAAVPLAPDRDGMPYPPAAAGRRMSP